MVANAQVQRMVLSEEFTNASCGPCASQNPAYDALLQANTSKIISLKYQAPFPGVDPMNAQNPTDVTTRMNLYSVNGVPYAPMDGDTNITGPQAYNGAPFNYNQTMIDARYAVPANWSISLSHTLNATLDSIFITCVVTPDTTNPDTTGLKLHISLIEKEIRFNTPPGTNGEKEFYNVMRKMYPSAAGQSLNVANANGAFTYTVAAKLPTYLYDKGQVGVVAFIQKNVHAGTTWDVKQAAISQPIALPLDGALSDMTTVSGTYFCGTTFTPTVTIQNPGLTAITSAVVSYTLDNGAAQTFNFSGSIAPGATEVVSLPAVTVGGGTHTFAASVTTINGASDLNSGNNSQSKSFTNYAGGQAALGYSNAFTANPLTAGTYSVINPDAGPSWTYSTAAGAGSMRMNFWQSQTIGEVDELVLPPFSTTGATVAKFTFKHAHSQFSDATTPPTNDRLQLMVSTDCGTTWTSLWDKAGVALATLAAPTSTLFVPTNTQWVTNEIQLPSSALNQASLLVKYKATSDWGNMAYIDDINISSNVGINDVTNNNSLSVYPNPFNESTTLKLNISKSENVSYNIVNTMGAIVGSENKGKLQAGESIINIDGSNLATGIYLMNVTVGNKTYSQKLNIVK